MYGVMAVATMILVGLALFSDLGLRQGVIQSRRGDDPVFLNTVWVTKIGVGALIAIGAACLAVVLVAAGALGILPAGTVYAEASLPYVIAALGLGPLIGGLDSTKAMEASRNLALKRLAQIQIVAQSAGLVAMLAMSLHHRSIWVLVSGALVATAVSTLLSHMWLPGARNRLQWDRNAFREVVGFGKWVLLSSALGFLGSTADKGLLAGVISAPVMGVYSIATLILGAVEQVFARFIGDVAFPAVSVVARQRREALKRTVYRLHTPLSLLAGGSAGLLLICAPDLIALLYDGRYHDAGWMLQILSLTLIALPARVHAASFLALGRSRVHFNVTLFHIVAMWGLIPAGIHLDGLTGALCAIALVHLLSVPVVLWWAAKEGAFDLRRELAVVVGLVCGVALGALSRGLLWL
jgi:O-antigen/teichoic acid export membrane protein